MTFAFTPKNLLTTSAVLLVLAAFGGLLNSLRVSALQTNLAKTAAARDIAEQRRSALERQHVPTGATGTRTSPRTADESNAAKAEADLAQGLKEKADLQTKLKA